MLSHYAVGKSADQLSERITASSPADAASHWMHHYRRHANHCRLFIQRLIDGVATGPVVEIEARVEVSTEVVSVSGGRLASSRGRVTEEVRYG
ncbi:MAG: hypothetical protein ACPGVY_13850 [Mycobacterium sp.]